MSNGEEQADFNRAYERACSVVAIADSHSATDAMKELLLQCFLLDKPQQPNSPAHLQALLQSLFGLPSSEAQVRASLASLVEAESLVTTGSDVRLSVGVQHDLTRRMEETVGLEHDIRDSWLAETSDYFPELPQDALWPALQEYLKQAFVRHGILTAALFDQSVNIGQDYVSSLTSMMTEVVAKRFDPAHQEAAGAALTQFLSSVTEQLPRAKYITQLANGTFNYYSLATAPDAAELLRSGLSALTLFLDTNFLFGVLNVSQNSQVDVSHELLREIHDAHLPFALRFHERTAQEMTDSLAWNHRRLSRARWTPVLSKLICGRRDIPITGIERKFHELNMQSTLDVDAFFRKYQDPVLLLGDKDIKIYRAGKRKTDDDYLDILSAYERFLRDQNREKPLSTTEHDATVLEVVRRLRSQKGSALDAKALLLTCDYTLYQFDWHDSHAHHRPMSAIMPNMFWQMLRPFVGANPEFDKAFAATFALPNFRIIGDDGARGKALRRLVFLLSGYQDVTEKTALRLLSNELLLQQLTPNTTDDDARQIVELTMAKDYDSVLQEAEALREQVVSERAARRKEDEQSEAELSRMSAVLDAERLRAEVALKASREAEAKARLEAGEAERLQSLVDAERANREKVEAAVQELAADTNKARVETERYRSIGLILLMLLLNLGFQMALRLLPLDWLINHPKGPQLQAAFGLLICCLCALLKPSWRAAAVGGGLLAAVVGAILALA